MQNAPEGFGLWLRHYSTWQESPYSHEEVEIWRDGWVEPRKVHMDKLGPEFNVYGVWWKPLKGDEDGST